MLNIMEIDKRLELGEKIKYYDAVLIHKSNENIRVFRVNKGFEVYIINDFFNNNDIEFIIDYCNEESKPCLICEEIASSIGWKNFYSTFCFKHKEYQLVELESLTKVVSVLISILHGEDYREYFVGEVPDL